MAGLEAYSKRHLKENWSILSYILNSLCSTYITTL